MPDSAHATDQRIARELWWLRVRGVLNWRWVVVVAVAVVLGGVIWLGRSGPQRTTCLQARATLNETQATLSRGDAAPEVVADARARGDIAFREVLAYCPKQQPPQSP